MIVKLVQIPQYNEWICDIFQHQKRSGKTWGESRILGGFMVDLWWIYRYDKKKIGIPPPIIGLVRGKSTGNHGFYH